MAKKPQQPKIDLYLAACQKLGKTPKPELADTSDKEAVHDDFYHRLRVCVAADNAIKQPDGTFKEWKAKNDGSEITYEPRFYNSGSGWVCDYYDYWSTYTDVGPRLKYRSYSIMLASVKKLDFYYNGLFNN